MKKENIATEDTEDIEKSKWSRGLHGFGGKGFGTKITEGTKMRIELKNADYVDGEGRRKIEWLRL